jgi:hypothetical protein
MPKHISKVKRWYMDNKNKANFIDELNKRETLKKNEIRPLMRRTGLPYPACALILEYNNDKFVEITELIRLAAEDGEPGHKNLLELLQIRYDDAKSVSDKDIKSIKKSLKLHTSPVIKYLTSKAKDELDHEYTRANRISGFAWGLFSISCFAAGITLVPAIALILPVAAFFVVSLLLTLGSPAVAFVLSSRYSDNIASKRASLQAQKMQTPMLVALQPGDNNTDNTQPPNNPQG